MLYRQFKYLFTKYFLNLYAFLNAHQFLCVCVCVFLCVGLCVYVSTFLQCVHMRVETNQPWILYLKAIHLAF